MQRFSLFRLFRICLTGTVLFIIITCVVKKGKYFPQTLARQQILTTSRPPCDVLPDRQSISINNIYWQTLTKDGVSFYFFNAYYDNRYKSPVRPAIRVTAMIDTMQPPQLYCRIWFSSKRSLIVKVHTYHHIWFKKWKLNKELQPFLITCPIPKKVSKLVPQHLSFITKNEACEQGTNLLRVIFNRPKVKQEFAVCVKGLDYPEDKNGTSTRLVEWLETLWLLGVHQVIFYVLQIHPNLRAVLEHYKSRGLVQIIPLTLPGNQPNEPKLQHDYLAKNTLLKRLNEVIPYNDCFYRNLYFYEYIAFLDTDEVIIPLGDASTWSQMLKTVASKAKKTCNAKGGVTSYMARNVYFMDDFLQNSHNRPGDIPWYMHMLQHVYRTTNDTDSLYRKGLHKTDNALTLHNHVPFEYLDNVCWTYTMDSKDALLYHYRTNCVPDMKKSKCEALRNNVVQDTRMWRYKDILTHRTTETLICLGFLNKNNKVT